MRGTKQNLEIKKEEARQRSESIFCDRASFFVSHSRASPRDALPSALRLPRPQCGLAMTQNWNVFIWKTGGFCFMRSFFCVVSLRIVFQTCRSEICSVFPQNLSVLSLRGGRVRPTLQSLTKQFLYCFCRIWELVLLFSPASRLFFQKNDVS